MHINKFFKTKLIFLPLLIFYIILVFSFSKNEFEQDEKRYVEYAQNISAGYYSPHNQVKLTNGPGYPLILVPFIVTNSPLLSIKLLNALLLFSAIIFFYLSIIDFSKNKSAIIFTYLLGLYPPILRYLVLIQPEVFTYFLFCVFLYSLYRIQKNKTYLLGKIVFSSSIFALIILTRVMFGWVALVGALFYIAISFKTKRNDLKVYSLIFFISLTFCLPYLIYTYSLTHRIFYWSTNSGDVLYWMSSPYEGEYGNSPNEEISVKMMYKSNSLRYNFFQSFKDVHSEFDRDNIEMQKALDNIKKYPLSYIKNCILNVGRLVYNYPNSFEFQNPKTLVYIVPNSFIVVLFIFSTYPLILLRKNIPMIIYFLVFIFLVYIGGSIFVTGIGRFTIVIIPLVFSQIVYTFTQNLTLTLKPNN